MQTTVSTKYQVVIPKEIRKKIKIKPGQKMDVEIVENRVTLSPVRSKESWSIDYYRKKLGGIWKDVDIDKYLEEEDKSWD